jgi:hypothetical protein
MKKLVFFSTIFLILASIYTDSAICASPSAEYLCEFGIVFYRQGRYEDALNEFNKALLIDPKNRTAKNYINTIMSPPLGQPAAVVAPKKQAAPPKETLAPKKTISSAPQAKPGREEAMDNALGATQLPPYAFSANPTETDKPQAQQEPGEDAKKDKFKIAGEAQMGLGIAAPGDFIWKRANYDLNERTWRMLSHAALDREFNTYDPRIYDSVSLDLDTQNISPDTKKPQGLNLHSNITVDPWSFTGKSSKFVVTSTGGDSADVEIKYWSNTGYTVNETIYTNSFGNSFNLPEVKLKDNLIDPFTVSGAFTVPAADSFPFSGMKIYREFQPVREMWVDYNQDMFNFRAFPIAYQDQAYISDDPLGITNHHIWWEDSMWLSNYHPGIYNSGATPVDFTKGWWDDHLAFLCRDSSGTYLTALRGASFTYRPFEQTSLDTTVATPKNLWQNYEVVDNIISASRLKHKLRDNLSLGGTFTTRSGLNENKDYDLDSTNLVEGLDLGYEIFEGVKASGEILASQSQYDKTNSDYRTKANGNAYYFSIITRYPQKSLMDLTYGYDEIKLAKTEPFLFKTKFFFSHMDHGFDSALSTFRNTRYDQFWSRHITFRKPFDYYYAGLKYPSIKWDEVNAIRIGDGIDIGRNVVGFRAEAICENKYTNLFDVRNVHNVNGKFIENVVRDELEVKFGKRLTARGLGIYHKLPKTHGGIDPFIFDPRTGEFAADWSATPIADGLNPTLKTGSLGLEYLFYDWLSANGVWEYTNDYSLGYANFPRSVLNSMQLGRTYYEYDRKYRGEQLYVYDQQLFPQPPYDFYNIYKCGFRVKLAERMEVYLDYTRNEFEMAAQNSDNMNHVGFEFSYMPTKKFGMLFKYNYSRWKDLDRLREGIEKVFGHHNFYTEFRFLPSKEDELIMQYGEGNISPIGNITFDPYGGALTTIDTQHIFRFYYRRKF